MIPTSFALFERIEVGGVAPVGAVSGQLGKIAVLLQIRQCPLDGKNLWFKRRNPGSKKPGNG